MLTSNISGVTYLDVQNETISDLTGIEDFTALTDLNCASNILTTFSCKLIQSKMNAGAFRFTELNVTEPN
jgi:Leucine-rich repeat (LRR) protein